MNLFDYELQDKQEYLDYSYEEFLEDIYVNKLPQLEEVQVHIEKGVNALKYLDRESASMESRDEIEYSRGVLEMTYFILGKDISLEHIESNVAALEEKESLWKKIKVALVTLYEKAKKFLKTIIDKVKEFFGFGDGKRIDDDFQEHVKKQDIPDSLVFSDKAIVAEVNGEKITVPMPMVRKDLEAIIDVLGGWMEKNGKLYDLKRFVELSRTLAFATNPATKEVYGKAARKIIKGIGVSSLDGEYTLFHDNFRPDIVVYGNYTKADLDVLNLIEIKDRKDYIKITNLGKKYENRKVEKLTYDKVEMMKTGLNLDYKLDLETKERLKAIENKKKEMDENLEKATKQLKDETGLPDIILKHLVKDINLFFSMVNSNFVFTITSMRATYVVQKSIVNIIKAVEASKNVTPTSS